MTGFKLNPSHVRAGQTTKLMIALTTPAPVGGTTITITNDNRRLLPLPQTITIPAGSKRMDVNIKTGSVSSKTDIGLSVTFLGVTRKDKVTIDP